MNVCYTVYIRIQYNRVRYFVNTATTIYTTYTIKLFLSILIIVYVFNGIHNIKMFGWIKRWFVRYSESLRVWTTVRPRILLTSINVEKPTSIILTYSYRNNNKIISCKTIPPEGDYHVCGKETNNKITTSTALKKCINQRENWNVYMNFNHFHESRRR